MDKLSKSRGRYEKYLPVVTAHTRAYLQIIFRYFKRRRATKCYETINFRPIETIVRPPAVHAQGDENDQLIRSY